MGILPKHTWLVRGVWLRKNRGSCESGSCWCKAGGQSSGIVQISDVEHLTCPYLLNRSHNIKARWTRLWWLTWEDGCLFFGLFGGVFWHNSMRKCQTSLHIDFWLVSKLGNIWLRDYWWWWYSSKERPGQTHDRWGLLSGTRLVCRRFVMIFEYYYGIQK